MLGELDPYRAFCLNQAAALAGMLLQQEAEAAARAPADPMAQMMERLGALGALANGKRG